MQLDILSLFPEYFDSPINTSIIKRAIEKRLIKLNCINIRDFTEDKHKKVDDRPFGGEITGYSPPGKLPLAGPAPQPRRRLAGTPLLQTAQPPGQAQRCIDGHQRGDVSTHLGDDVGVGADPAEAEDLQPPAQNRVSAFPAGRGGQVEAEEADRDAYASLNPPSLCLISLATTTPEAEACTSPRVTPAPSPMANILPTSVSRHPLSSSREE